MNQFSERYKNHSDLDLLKIIENQSDYQQDAVNAAQKELDQRNLSEEVIKKTETELAAELLTKRQKEEQIIEVERKLKKFGDSFFDHINPIQKSAPTIERIIRLIVIVFGIISIYSLYREFWSIVRLVTSSPSEWDLSVLEFVLALITLPLATFFFWKKKKSGWILMTVYLTYSAISAIALLIMALNYEPFGDPFLGLIYPAIYPSTYIFLTLFYIGTIWVLMKKELRNKFKIDQKTAIITITVVAVLSSSFIAPLIL
jgi:hypothetical protein